MVKEMGCSGNSIKGWLIELVECGWLAVYREGEPVTLEELRRKKDNKQDAAGARSYQYLLKDGAGGPWPGRKQTVLKTENGLSDAKPRTVRSQNSSKPFSEQRTYLMTPIGSGVVKVKNLEGKNHGEATPEKVEERWVVPRFDAIQPGTYRSGLFAMESAAREERAKVKRQDAAWVIEDRVDARVMDDIAWTNAELLKVSAEDKARREKLEWDLKQLEARRVQRVRVRLVPEADAVVKAWTKRIEDIERAVTGAREE